MSKTNPLIHQPWFWDIQIAALLICPPLISIWISATMNTLPAWIVAALLILGSLTVAYGSFIEPMLLYVNKKVIHTFGLPALKIALAADFHVGPYRDASDLRRIVQTINKEQPDLILLAGDFLYDQYADCAHLEPLSELHAQLGVYAVMGNHDTGDHVSLRGKRYNVQDRSGDVTSCLTDMGITVLRDAWKNIEADGKNFVIAGVDGAWADTMNLAKTFENIPAELPVLLLAHNPDVVLNKQAERADLIVSGHTHGGQIRMPFIGALHVPAETGKKYDQGIFSITEKTTLAVTHGCGETLARARLMCVPEILVLENKIY